MVVVEREEAVTIASSTCSTRRASRYLLMMVMAEIEY